VTPFRNDAISLSGAQGRPPHQFRWCGTNVDTDATGDRHPPSVHKIKFPKFDGSGDGEYMLRSISWTMLSFGTSLELNGGPPSNSTTNATQAFKQAFPSYQLEDVLVVEEGEMS
jgi:hypothetical protein